MKEELLLEHKFGKPRPFRIPDGYFEKLEHDVMSRAGLPAAASRRPLLRRLRPVTWAACAAVAVVSAAVYLSVARGGDGLTADTQADPMPAQAYSDYMVDELSDFAMLDNDDLYSLMADE